MKQTVWLCMKSFKNQHSPSLQILSLLSQEAEFTLRPRQQPRSAALTSLEDISAGLHKAQFYSTHLPQDDPSQEAPTSPTSYPVQGNLKGSFFLLDLSHT